MVLRRRLAAVLLLSLVLAPFVVARTGGQGRTELCVHPATALRIGNTLACVHADPETHLEGGETT